MKTYKLNTINLTSDIFVIQNEPIDKIMRSIKTPSSCNKRFKYNYEKSKPVGSSSLRKDRQRKNTIDEEDMMPEVGQLKTMFQRQAKEIKHAISVTRNRRNTVSHQITLESQQEQHEIKQQNVAHTDSKTLQASDSVHKGKSMNYVMVNLQGQNEKLCTEVKMLSEQRQSQMACDLMRQKQSPAVNIIKSKYQYSKNATQVRNAPSNKYTNSIIKSYQVKAIDLVDPLLNNRKKYLLRNADKSGPSYFIDLGNDYNLKQIYLQDLQKIQLRKCVYDHKRALSNQAKQHKRAISRPFTPNISHKFEDFEPKPWDSEQKPDFIYQSKVQNLD